MCELCALTQTFDPSRHTGGHNESQTIFEGRDAEAGTSTSYYLNIGDTFSGALSAATGEDEEDWIAVELEAGQAYEFDIDAYWGGGGTLLDSYLTLYDANGNYVAHNDDTGYANLDSLLTHTASTSGTYYIAVSSYQDRFAGTYDLVVSHVGTGPAPTPSAPEGDLDTLAEYLTDGHWEDSGRSGRRFDTSTSNEIRFDISNLTADGQRLAQWAFQAWELVADITFVEADYDIDITFDDNESGAYSTSDVSYYGYINASHVNVSTNWLDGSGTSIDSYSLTTYIHEIGHALGLGHQGQYNGSATYGSSETFSNDSWQISIMSYFSQTENTTIDADYALPVTAMMADIVAIQNLYGAPEESSPTTGDTTWGYDTNLEGYFEDLLNGETDAAVAFTIYDANGTDLLNLTHIHTDNRVDMNDMTYSDVGGLTGNIGIARGTVIENASLGNGDDTVIGNAIANTIAGGAGHDTLEGNAGFDTLHGEDGDDSLVGGTGEDQIHGGEGNDTLYGNTSLDTIHGDRGNDYISAGDGVDWVDGGSGDDTIHGRSGWDSLYGGAGNDSIVGSSGDDLLAGNDGNDWMSGGSAWDVLFGNNGNDTLYGNFGSDVLSGGAGEDVLYGGTGDDTLRGLDGEDYLQGNQGVDRLDGGAGDDVLRGGTLADTFIYGLGYDEDEIEDFRLGEDQLNLSLELLDGLSDANEVLAQFGATTSDALVLDFGDGDILTLTNLFGEEALAALADDIHFF